MGYNETYKGQGSQAARLRGWQFFCFICCNYNFEILLRMTSTKVKTKGQTKNVEILHVLRGRLHRERRLMLVVWKRIKFIFTFELPGPLRTSVFYHTRLRKKHYTENIIGFRSSLNELCFYARFNFCCG
jgi:hypothetical protein